MEIVLASGNRHKLDELRKILPRHTLLLPEDLGVEFDYDETGITYLENSTGKGFALYDKIQRPVLADDSGLSVRALDGAPGIYSARYGSSDGVLLEASNRNSYLLNKMSETRDRYAEFICCMTFILDRSRFFVAQEAVSGEITREPAGVNGFGYDPLFFLKDHGKTIAELPEDVKNTLSHRALAGRRIASILDNRV